jgi:tetratricopeptide (TPR) repeat protein
MKIILGLAVCLILAGHASADLQQDYKDYKQCIIRAQVASAQGDWAVAITNCNHAIALATNSANAYEARAWARDHLGDHAGARADYDQALQSLRLYIPEPKAGPAEDTQTNYAGDPKAMAVGAYVQIYAWRGWVEFELQDWDAALADFNRVVARRPYFSDVYRLRGEVRLCRHQDWLAALDDFNQAIKLDNRNAVAYYDRARMKNQLGDTDGAAADRRRALVLKPNLLDKLPAK